MNLNTNRSSVTSSNKSLPKTTLPCPCCNGQLSIKDSQYGYFFGCSNYPNCRVTHKADRLGRPIGIPADPETKGWRIKAHKIFNSLFEGDFAIMRRGQAYSYLAKIMNVPPQKAHISMFTATQCQQLVNLLTKEVISF